MINAHFIGIDIAKLKFDIAFKKNNKWLECTFENNQQGHKLFLKWLKNYTHNPFICLEATGAYGEILAEYLIKHNVEVSIVNPMQIKHYAKSLLSRNKNDRVDARIIASYAEKYLPPRFNIKSPEQRLLRESVQLIEVLNHQKTQLRNQLETLRTKEVMKTIEKMICSIDKQVLQVEETMKASIKNNADYAEKKQRLMSLVGIGEKTANKFIAYCPEIENFNKAKQLAAYIGATPKQYQSGKYSGKTRLSKCGNAELRKAFYMPALVAKNSNPYLKEFCERLKKNGLKPKQIICAVMRKLIHIIFGMLKNKQDFNPDLLKRA